MRNRITILLATALALADDAAELNMFITPTTLSVRD